MFRNLFKPRPVDPVQEEAPPPLVINHTVGLIRRLLEERPDEWVEDDSLTISNYWEYRLVHPTGAQVRCYSHYARSISALAGGVNIKLKDHEAAYLDEGACHLLKGRRDRENAIIAAENRMKISQVEDKIALALFGRDED
jgi:hypothetical protein